MIYLHKTDKFHANEMVGRQFKQTLKFFASSIFKDLAFNQILTQVSNSFMILEPALLKAFIYSRQIRVLTHSTSFLHKCKLQQVTCIKTIRH